MDRSKGAPTIWNQLAETMYLKGSSTAEVRLSEVTAFSFGRLQNRQGLLEVARSVVGESGYIVALQLKAIPFIEQFLGKKKVSSGPYPVGGVSVIQLQEEPAVLLPNPFDALVMYVTQAALDEIAYAHQSPRVEQLIWPYGVIDPVVHHLGQTLLSSLEQPHHSSKIFLDHVLHALNCHFAYSYGGMTKSTPKVRGGLSPWQMRRATELLDAHLHGNIALQQVAEACDLSLGHFARAFKKTFRRPPHTWLIERRIEKAKDFMMTSRLSLADVAARSGFADQSAFNRSFKRIQGISPGMWRRGSTRGNSTQYNSSDVETSSSRELQA